ncbi:MAG: hypothetical protein ABI548_16070 [Polyangiaceae bacterium]
MIHCIEVQERIALGEPLPGLERSHLSSCAHCSSVAETYSLLDASLESLAEPVPQGFADRVISRLAGHEVARSPRWFNACWVELAFANLALACALLNTVRFLAGVLIPTVSLGATP